MPSSSSRRHPVAHHLKQPQDLKTFISGEKFPLNLQEDDNVREFLQNHRIQWRHQTPRSLWMGEHFERLVRTIKTSLSSAIARKLKNQEEFTTIVKEVKNIVNGRPLTYQSNNASDQQKNCDMLFL